MLPWEFTECVRGLKLSYLIEIFSGLPSGEYILIPNEEKLIKEHLSMVHLANYNTVYGTRGRIISKSFEESLNYGLTVKFNKTL